MTGLSTLSLLLPLDTQAVWTWTWEISYHSFSLPRQLKKKTKRHYISNMQYIPRETTQFIIIYLKTLPLSPNFLSSFFFFSFVAEVGGGQREKENPEEVPCPAWSPKWVSIPQPQDHDQSKTKSQNLNQMKHPGAPYILFQKKGKLPIIPKKNNCINELQLPLCTLTPQIRLWLSIIKNIDKYHWSKEKQNKVYITNHAWKNRP